MIKQGREAENSVHTAHTHIYIYTENIPQKIYLNLNLSYLGVIGRMSGSPAFQSKIHLFKPVGQENCFSLDLQTKSSIMEQS